MHAQNASKYTRMIQCCNTIEFFNYDICVDWAEELLLKGIITDNIQIIASFSKPVNSLEIKPYVSMALKELNLEFFNKDKAVQNYSHYFIAAIIHDEGDIISNLSHLCDLCIGNEYSADLFPFYLLKFSWDDLKDLGESYHYEGVNAKNFQATAIREAEIWLGNYNKLED